MTFPAILSATANIWSALAGFIIAVFLAYRGKSLLKVSLFACLGVFYCWADYRIISHISYRKFMILASGYKQWIHICRKSPYKWYKWFIMGIFMQKFLEKFKRKPLLFCFVCIRTSTPFSSVLSFSTECGSGIFEIYFWTFPTGNQWKYNYSPLHLKRSRKIWHKKCTISYGQCTTDPELVRSSVDAERTRLRSYNRISLSKDNRLNLWCAEWLSEFCLWSVPLYTLRRTTCTSHRNSVTASGHLIRIPFFMRSPILKTICSFLLKHRNTSDLSWILNTQNPNPAFLWHPILPTPSSKNAGILLI